MMGALIVYALVAIAAANAAWWWYVGRVQGAKLRFFYARTVHLTAQVDQWRTRAVTAESAQATVENEVASLRERNQLLCDLGGGDQP
ncbi:hypothetical protein ABT294_00800 [Nonomuraea sp. NPDC000554]|uniref:hypothetical protein n=1 Tax=Nonomuraea sp. NPDC000554 TaxID=3154259 RepID=UPI00332AE21E